MKIKNNKGITMSDLVVSVVILMIFLGTLGTLFYEISKNTSLIRTNMVAVNYAIKIAEDTDKMSYSEVNNDLNNNIKSNYGIIDSYDVLINVENYNDIDTTKQDLIKIVTIQVKYSIFGEDKTYQIKKLKVKEI